MVGVFSGCSLLAPGKVGSYACVVAVEKVVTEVLQHDVVFHFSCIVSKSSYKQCYKLVCCRRREESM